MKDKKKIKNNKFYLLALALVIIIIIVIVISSVNNKKQDNKDNDDQNIIQKDPNVSEYRKIWFESVLCTYNCDLKKETVKNKTQMMPNKTCVENCAIPFRDYKSSLIINFSKLELNQDGLVIDVQNTLNKCINQSISPELKAVNIEALFLCSKTNLEVLKEKYDYLNQSS